MFSLTLESCSISPSPWCFLHVDCINTLADRVESVDIKNPQQDTMHLLGVLLLLPLPALGFPHRARARFWFGHWFSVGHNYSVGMRSSPIQNLGGIGRSSRSSFALVDGSVKGRGSSPPRSAVEQETPNKMQAAPARRRLSFIGFF